MQVIFSNLSPGLSPEARELISKSLSHDFNERPSWEEISRVSLLRDHPTTPRHPTPLIVRCCHSRFVAATVATRRQESDALPHCVHGPSRRVPPP
jgi:serine/threonine protein kinase